ncbi:hypothetical protein LPJ81_003374, partial [Coemansia sp. IMI 209127]
MVVRGETAVQSASVERSRRQFDSNALRTSSPGAHKKASSAMPNTTAGGSIYAPELLGTAIEYYFYPNSSVPVFCPTMEQFKDFEGLVAAIEPLAVRGGVCKIIPPRVWRSELERSAQKEKEEEEEEEGVRVFADESFPIMKPIVQHFNGSSGIFHQYNVEYHRKLKLAQFFQISQDDSHRMPKPKTVDAANSRETKDGEKEEARSDEQRVVESETVGIAVDYETGKIRLTSAAAEALKSQTRSEAMRAKFQAAEASYRPQPDTQGEAAGGAQGWRQFTEDGRALFVSQREYEENEELERSYWKNMLFQPPLYGADVLGTLFPECSEFPHWNIRNLPGLLRQVGQRMPGVNDPYLYLGMWKATFAWHVEDMDLYSINYIHFGAPKAWYSIPIEAHNRFEMSMQNVFANDYKSCTQFLRHKAFLLSPRFLAAQGIPFNRVVQRAGEIILTFPMGYHAGYNHGFNCAESVNFAVDKWLDVAWDSKHCMCVRDSVTIDLMEWFGDQRKERKAAREGIIDVVGDSRVQRDSPRRHAAAAAATAKNTSGMRAEDAPGRTAKAKEDGPGAKRKQSVASARQGVPEAKRTPRKTPKKTVAVSNEGGMVIDESEAAVDVRRRFASLHTPVGACGGCLQPIAGLKEQSIVECTQCGLTVHPQCSALAFDDGHYRCANCVMDTDQLGCTLCAFQNGLLLPAASAHNSEFVHFLCAHFIDETYFDFQAVAGSSGEAKASGEKDEEKDKDDGVVSTRARAAAKGVAATKQAIASRTSIPRKATRRREEGVMYSSAQVCGVAAINRSSYTGRCVFCHSRVPESPSSSLKQCVGPVVQCAHPRCFRSLHPMCAAVRDPRLLDWSRCKIFCDRHMP